MLFTGKPKAETFVRVILTIVVLFNAVIPTTALAMSPSSEESTSLQSETRRNGIAQGFKSARVVSRSDTSASEIVETDAPVSQVSAGNPIPESIFTPTPDELFAQMPDIARADNQTTPRFVFSASPSQAAPGDEVQFTIIFTNNGSIEVRGITFTNLLPDQLKNPKSENKGFEFDHKTKTINWSSELMGEDIVVLPGESITFEYSATVDSRIDKDLQIIDEANLFIDGVTSPSTENLVLSIFLDNKAKKYTPLGSQGGQANSIDGTISINVPNGELNAFDGILIKNLDNPSQVEQEQPLMVFQLDVLSHEQEVQLTEPEIPAETATPPAVTSTIESTPTFGETVTETPTAPFPGDDAAPIDEAPSNSDPTSPTETITPTIEPSPTLIATPSAVVEEFSIPTPAPEEQDITSSLELQKASFDQAVEITVSFEGILDLSELSAENAPYLASLNEDSGTWVRVPLKSVDREKNTITAEVLHFSTWGAGIGLSSPQNGANILLFDNPYPGLFSGRSNYSLPIWTPPGRNGMTPSLALSYSSGTADGVLGDVQAPWVGMGWNVDLVEIVRKITNGNCSPCGSGSYGYENKFLLLINGKGYELIPDGTTPGRYHTKTENFLYIQLHNANLGNNMPPAQNASGEWWEIVERDGTRFRLGWNADSEQLANMSGYPGAPTGSWASLGYAGNAADVVAFRWRVDQGTDTHGNGMNIAYFEENRLVAGTSASYDRASYLDTITYSSHTSGNPAPGYSVVFVRESRGGSDLPSTQNDWDNWDTDRLDRIEVKYGSNVMRTYDLGYTVNSYSDDGVSWQTTVLSSMAVSGGSANAPTMTFTYADQDNRANCGTGCQEWAYPRLASASNGWGGTTTYAYNNDGRPSTSWYNWRVETLEIADGNNVNPMKTTVVYDAPCYNDPTSGWCNAGNTGELIGYGQITAATKDFDGTTTLAISVHKFHTDEQRAGREHEIQNQNASGTILRQANVTYTISTVGLPAGGYFTFASAIEEFLRTTGLVRISRNEYEYDTATGNLIREKQFDGTPSLYRQTEFEYVTNMSASVWILNTVSRRMLKDSAGVTLSKQEFGYDGNLPGIGSPTTGELTLSRVVDGTLTIDNIYLYDTYGNLTDRHLFENYGATGSQPGGPYLIYSAAYDTALKTYVTSSTNPLNHVTQIGYDFGLGLPTSVTDSNNNTITSAYDGLGRVTSLTYPGYAQPNVKYTYPSPPVSAPSSIQQEVWDETASVYRSSWQILDGLGRMIQSQSPYETAGTLVLNDVSYNAQGMTLYQGLPRTITSSGGSYFTPTWGSIPHTTTSYDALGRPTSIAHPDSSQELISYSGLRTTIIDRDNHQKVQEIDAFGRLAKVEEYTGAGTYTLYGTTTYQYDPRNLLKQVMDAQSNQTTLNYNGFGRKTSMTDPDMGSWSYDYDVFGNLTSQTDARNCITTVGYDDLNRLTQKSYSGPGACATTPSVTYTYDSTTAGNEGVGHRTGMTDGSGSSTWFYNDLGQATNKTQNIDGTNYDLDFTLDALGRPLTQTLPSGETLNYGYNAMGMLSSLSGTNTYVSNIHYDASGQATDQILGNGLVQQACYEADTLRLSNLRVYSGSLQNCGTSPASFKLDLSYNYEPNGNISQIVDTTQEETIDYSYDELDRLLSASGNEGQDFAYNEGGNVVSMVTTPKLTDVSTGGTSSCGITGSGGVKCWGSNYYGQIGDNTLEPERLLPVDVYNLTSGVVATSVGRDFACAVTETGGLKCWGANYWGQLGDGTTTSRPYPAYVSGLTSGVVAVSAGEFHACALLSNGGMKCWGVNGDGQLGDGTKSWRTSPVDVYGLTSGVAEISAGFYHTCAVTTSGGAKCWGNNPFGQLGNGQTKDQSKPVNVSGLTSGVAKISAGIQHTCAVTTSGSAKCWGNNTNGKLGDGTTTQRITPVNVVGLSSGVEIIQAGGGNSCALMTSGDVKCWGGNTYGELGNGTTNSPELTPVDVIGLVDSITKIDSGSSRTCTVAAIGEIKCWGSNANGEFGNGTKSSINPNPVNADFSIVNGYDYDDLTSVHAVTSLDNGDTFDYDENGNMIERLENGLVYYQTFDAENRLVSVTVASQTTQFIYDGDGNLTTMIKPDGSKTIFVGRIYEEDKTSGGSVTRSVTYYPAGSAVRINGTVYYVLKDHLGSANATTDSAGNIVGEMRYYAFGETRFLSGTMFTDRLFTGQRYMAGIGLYHYNARFYSATLGRFISADTIVSNPYNSQNLNRFSYVMNNPIRYTDPSGHDIQCSLDGDCYETCDYNCASSSTNSDDLREELDNFEQPDGVDEDEMINVGIFPFTDQVSPDEYELLLNENGNLDIGLLWEMYQTQQEALSTAGEQFPDMSLHNSPADAFRHAYWNALLTQEFGFEFAESFTTAHETGYAPYPNREEVFMDLHNNEIGRDIAISYPDASAEELQEIVMDSLRAGDLYVWDGEGIYFSNTCPTCSFP